MNNKIYNNSGSNVGYELEDEIEYMKKYIQVFSNPKFYEYLSPFIAADTGPKMSLQQCVGIYNAYVNYSMQIPEIMMRFWMPNKTKK